MTIIESFDQMMTYFKELEGMAKARVGKHVTQENYDKLVQLNAHLNVKWTTMKPLLLQSKEILDTLEKDAAKYEKEHPCDCPSCATRQAMEKNGITVIEFRLSNPTEKDNEEDVPV